jgi:iron complex outermembrane receptor protein
MLGGAAAALTGAQAAYAQEAAAAAADDGSALEEIVVTARRRTENLQTTPVAVTAVTAQTLEARNIVNLADLSRLSPSLNVQPTPGSTGSAGMAMRGISYADNIIGQDGPIGIYVDGVAFGRISTAVMDLVEPERIEVLRGPQGTLFGRNTTAGAILITTHTPSNEFGGQVKASYGSYNATAFQGRIDTGLLGESGIKMSMAYSHREKDGFQDNKTQPDNLDPGAEESDAYWFKAQGEWGRFRASIAGDYSELNGVPSMLQVVDASAAVRTFIANSASLYGGGTIPITLTPLETVDNYATRPVQHVWNQGISATLEFEVNENLTLKSISALRAYKRDDASAYGPGNLRGPSPTGAIITYPGGLYAFLDRHQSQRQKSQEIQALVNYGDFDLVAGGYYFKENAWDAGVTQLPFVIAGGAAASNVLSPRNYSVASKSVAGFAQLDWRPAFLDKKLELTGGVRWTKDNRDFVQTLALRRTANLETKNTSFLLSGNYQWTDGLMTYVRYSTGYRAGGFNARSTPPIDPIYQPEKIKSLEAGFKFEGFDRRVRLNGAAYYNKYSDLQIAQFAPPDPNGAGGTQAINANARYKGFELELFVVPVDRLTVSASVGYVDPEYKAYPRALEGGVVSTGCAPIRNSANAITGQDCAAIASFTQFAKTTADFSIAYEFPETGLGTPSIRADYSYRGRTQWGTFNLPSSPFQRSIVSKEYGLLGVRASLSDIPLSGDARASLSFFGKNLTDERFNAQGIDFGYMATVNYSEGRTVGIEGKVEF